MNRGGGIHHLGWSGSTEVAMTEYRAQCAARRLQKARASAGIRKSPQRNKFIPLSSTERGANGVSSNLFDQW
jgi:hypothetical protein